jgi:hypothetical protein
MTGSRFTAWASLALVTGIAGVASYFHALDVVQAADGRGPVSFFIPFLADFVIASAAANMLDASRGGDGRPRWSIAAAGAGIAMTLYMNWKAGNPGSVPSWLVNVWPPVAFGLTLESLVGLARRSGPVREPRNADPVPAGETPDLEDDLRLLIGRHSVRQVHLLTRAPRNRLYALAKPAQAVSPDVSANGAGPDGA